MASKTTSIWSGDRNQNLNFTWGLCGDNKTPWLGVVSLFVSANRNALDV